MKRISILFCTLFTTITLMGQHCAQWPADCPETGFIDDARSITRTEDYGLLQQEVNMQDSMRTVFTEMMQNASQKLGWKLVEISEYTNNDAMQGAGTPYSLRSPRGIVITFQFVANPQALSQWRVYENDYLNNQYTDKSEEAYNNIQNITQSPEYKSYKDSADYYMTLYLSYIKAHQSEGTALYTTDKYPKYYQQKESAFLDKMQALTNDDHNSTGMEDLKATHNVKKFQFRNQSVVQVEFYANNFVGIALDQTLGSIKSSAFTYPLPNAVLAKLYSTNPKQDNQDIVKWENILLVLLGNFQTKPNENGNYDAGFNLNKQGDEHTPKKIKSDKVQNISIKISGNKANIDKIIKLIDLEKLNSTIIK